MKTIKINRLSATNFQGFGEIDLTLQGRNCIITGENGSGKTTHFNLYTWLICNRMSDGKTAEVANYNDAQIATGEVEFDNGMTFRRESNGKYFVNGVPTSQVDYFNQIDVMTNGGIKVLAMPFNFCRLPWKDRRDILIGMAGENSIEEVIAAAPPVEVIREMLKTLTPEQIKKQATARRKKYSEELNGIPARIDELKKRPTTDAKAEAIKAEIAALEMEIGDLEKQIEEATPTTLNKTIDDVSAGIDTLQAQIATLESNLKNFRKEYVKLVTAVNGTCPFCGAPLSQAKSDSLTEQLHEVRKRGVQAAEDLKVKKRALETAEMKLAEMEKQAAAPQSDIKTLLKELSAAQQSLAEERAKLEQVNQQEANRTRISELMKHEQELGKILSKYDAIIDATDLFNQTQAALTESKINALFRHVKFQLFARLKTQDALKACCEPLINGVPYEALSTGEKFKAASDIWRALKEYYQVAMPLWLDNAENYSNNSLIKIGNQQLIALFVTAEGGLEIRYVEGEDED